MTCNNDNLISNWGMGMKKTSAQLNIDAVSAAFIMCGFSTVISLLMSNMMLGFVFLFGSLLFALIPGKQLLSGRV